jgi:Uma2 family endonuclease
MNVAVIHPAEDLPPRRAFTTEDVRRMIEAGVIGVEERFELIGGEIVMMAAKGYAHEVVKSALIRAIVLVAPDDVHAGVEMTIELSRDTLVEPDIALFPKACLRRSSSGFAQLAKGECLLVIEVAASRLSYDMDAKAKLFAEFGVQEYWVVEANERVTWVHTGPSGHGWSSIVERGSDETLTTVALPGFSVRLDQIG